MRALVKHTFSSPATQPPGRYTLSTFYCCGVVIARTLLPSCRATPPPCASQAAGTGSGSKEGSSEPTHAMMGGADLV